MPQSRKKKTEDGSADTKKVIRFKRKSAPEDSNQNPSHALHIARSFKGGHNQTSSGDGQPQNEGGHNQSSAGLNHSPASEGGHSQGSTRRNKQYGNRGRYNI